MSHDPYTDRLDARLALALYYDDASASIEWLREAFRFEVRFRVEGENCRILHSELTYGEAVAMVAQAGGWIVP